MERPLKNRVSSLIPLIALLAACYFGLGRANADVAADSTKNLRVDTTLSPDTLRQRGAELDNYIYEASDVSANESTPIAVKEAPSTENVSIRPQTLWIAAGVACLLGVGAAYLLFGH